MKPRTIIVLLVFLVMGFGGYKYHRWQQQSAIETALAYGRLAPLPNAATDVRVDTEGSMFSRTFWLCFKADKALIDQWVAQSSSLSRQAPVVLPAASSLLGEAPDWFDPRIIKRGMKFNIPSNEEELYGTVWIDYASGTVFIKTSHS